MARVTVSVSVTQTGTLDPKPQNQIFAKLSLTLNSLHVPEKNDANRPNEVGDPVVKPKTSQKYAKLYNHILYM